MGWLFTDGQSRRDLIVNRTRDWERETPDGTVTKSKCLAHCYRGGVFSGVLWSVWERTFLQGGQQIKQAQRWIACDLLRCEQGVWGYKDLDEAMFPYFFSCPLSYLNLVPIEQFGGNPEWRDCVRSYHARNAEKRRARKATRAS